MTIASARVQPDREIDSRSAAGDFQERLTHKISDSPERPFSALVMFLPDREHRFPWQSGYADIPAEESLAIV